MRLRDISEHSDVTERRNLTNDFLNFYFGRAYPLIEELVPDDHLWDLATSGRRDV